MTDSMGISQPFPIFFEKSGQPLDAGYIYIGETNKNPEAYPVQVYWDANLTLPAPQPLRTIGGYYSNNGTPAKVFVNGTSCSITVRNKSSSLVWTDLNSIKGQFVTSGLSASLVIDSSGSTQQQINDANKQKFRSVLDYGMVASYSANNNAAWAAIVATGYKSWYIPEGVYGFSDGIDIPDDMMLLGAGVPTLGFATADDKVSLVSGQKNNLRGSVFIFKGTGTKYATQSIRTDDMASFSYCVRVYSATGSNTKSLQMTNIAIVKDINCFTSAGVAIKPTDSAAAPASYDVGLVLDDTAQGYYEKICVWGYFPKAGQVTLSKSGNDDPDYNSFWKCQFSGRYGVAILGADDSQEVSFGLSGSDYHGCKFYSNDHHARGSMTTAEIEAYYATNNVDQWRALYIDGNMSGTTEINGHYFYDCLFRSNCEHIFEFDHCSNVHFFGGVCENPMRGVVGSTTATWLATENCTVGITFRNLRMSNLTLLTHPLFIGRITARVEVWWNGFSYFLQKDPNDSASYTAITIGGDGGNGDAKVQLSRTVSSNSLGWQIQIDASDTTNDPLLIRKDTTEIMRLNQNGDFILSGAQGKTVQKTTGLTPSSGEINPIYGYHSIIGTSTISTINNGVAGYRLLLRPSASGDVVTINNTGNIRFKSGTSLTLNGSLNFAEFIYTGAVWQQLF